MIHVRAARYWVALLIAACVGVFASGASASPSAGPTVRGVSACTEELPFAIEGFVDGLQPNTSYGVRALFAWGGTASTIFTTDATGSSHLGGVGAPQPFEVRVQIWLNPDGDLDQDAGEPIVLDQTLIVDRPCEDARLKLPTSKAQCRNGHWRDFGVFKNEGDCVSFVARPS